MLGIISILLIAAVELQYSFRLYNVFNVLKVDTIATLTLEDWSAWLLLCRLIGIVVGLLGLLMLSSFSCHSRRSPHPHLFKHLPVETPRVYSIIDGITVFNLFAIHLCINL